MSFKAFNHQRKEETRHSYAYSHSTKHLTLLAKNRKAQSALEYMMTAMLVAIY